MTEAAARRLVKARSRGRCEGCRGVATDYSHRRRVNVQAGGHSWCPCNALHLCRTCHRWAHANPEKARLRGWHVSSYTEHPGDVPVTTVAGWFVLDCEGSGRHLHANEIVFSDGEPTLDLRDISRSVSGTQ